MIEDCGTLTFYQYHYLIAELLTVGLIFFGLWYWNHYFFSPIMQRAKETGKVLWWLY